MLKNTMKIIAFILIVLCTHPGYGQKNVTFTTSDYVGALKHATDVMITDVTSPVAAARYYAYINLAANETAALFDKQQPHFAGIIKGLDEIIVDNRLIEQSNAQLAII